ncbi:hypothetical protein TGME49_268240 [Toxoplasma gondii ME49]|uniref:Uncharacterized protein n=1 Tax=Toxoplasma gondii (strain ATCC 50611 / Me49) TaxID=508771 RepID=S8G8Y8_TOXGM|nr:hypothetical protein TGME49_268240 [Toxoplasma gondii ME49]EPT28225.1 hypothetical protein TGME49_268240 [Toxoplasma gondii ME49]|eukprot:XP_002365531.1 hypothetical protein TGME49_268240 [Toxoplasma gondii ME49]
MAAASRLSVPPSLFSSALAEASSFASPPPSPPSPPSYSSASCSDCVFSPPPLFTPEFLPPWFDKNLREAALAALPCCRACCSCSTASLRPVEKGSPSAGEVSPSCAASRLSPASSGSFSSLVFPSASFSREQEPASPSQAEDLEEHGEEGEGEGEKEDEEKEDEEARDEGRRVASVSGCEEEQGDFGNEEAYREKSRKRKARTSGLTPFLRRMRLSADLASSPLARAETSELEVPPSKGPFVLGEAALLSDSEATLGVNPRRPHARRSLPASSFIASQQRLAFPRGTVRGDTLTLKPACTSEERDIPLGTLAKPRRLSQPEHHLTPSASSPCSSLRRSSAPSWPSLSSASSCSRASSLRFSPSAPGVSSLPRSEPDRAGRAGTPVGERGYSRERALKRGDRGPGREFVRGSEGAAKFGTCACGCLGCLSFSKGRHASSRVSLAPCCAPSQTVNPEAGASRDLSAKAPGPSGPRPTVCRVPTAQGVAGAAAALQRRASSLSTGACAELQTEAALLQSPSSGARKEESEQGGEAADRDDAERTEAERTEAERTEEARRRAGAEEPGKREAKTGTGSAFEARALCMHQRSALETQIHSLQRLIWEFAFDPRDWPRLRQVDRAGRSFAETASRASLRLLRHCPAPTASPGVSRAFSRLGHLLPDLLLDCTMSDFLDPSSSAPVSLSASGDTHPARLLAVSPPLSPSLAGSRGPEGAFGASCDSARKARDPGSHCRQAEAPCLQNLSPLESGCGEWSVWLFDSQAQPPLRRLPAGAAAALGARSAGGLAQALAGAAETLEVCGEWVDYAEGTILLWGRREGAEAPTGSQFPVAEPEGRTKTSLETETREESDLSRSSKEKTGTSERFLPPPASPTSLEVASTGQDMSAVPSSSASAFSSSADSSLSSDLFREAQTFFQARYRQLLVDALHKQTLLGRERKSARNSLPGRFFEAAIAEVLAASPSSPHHAGRSRVSPLSPAQSLASATQATRSLQAFQTQTIPFLSDQTNTFLFDIVWARPRSGDRGIWGDFRPAGLGAESFGFFGSPLPSEGLRGGRESNADWPSAFSAHAGSILQEPSGWKRPSSAAGPRLANCPVSPSSFAVSASRAPAASLESRPPLASAGPRWNNPGTAPRVGGGLIVVYRRFADWVEALCHRRLWGFLFVAFSRGLEAAHAFVDLYDSTGRPPSWEGYLSGPPSTSRWRPCSHGSCALSAPRELPPLLLADPASSLSAPERFGLSPRCWRLSESVGSRGDSALAPVWRGRPLLQLRGDSAAPGALRGVLFERIWAASFLCHLRRRGDSQQGSWIPSGSVLLSSSPAHSAGPRNTRTSRVARLGLEVGPAKGERESRGSRQDEGSDVRGRFFRGRQTGDSRIHMGVYEGHDGNEFGEEREQDACDFSASPRSEGGSLWVRLPPEHLSLSPRAPPAPRLFSAFQKAMEARKSEGASGPRPSRPSLLDLEETAEEVTRDLCLDLRRTGRFRVSSQSPARFQSPRVEQQQEHASVHGGAAAPARGPHTGLSPPRAGRVSFLFSPSEPAPWRLSGRTRLTLPRDDQDSLLPVSPSVCFSADDQADDESDDRGPDSDRSAASGRLLLAAPGQPRAGKRMQTPPSPQEGRRSGQLAVSYPSRARQSSGGFSAQFRLAPRRRDDRRGSQGPRARRSSDPVFLSFFSPSPAGAPSGDEETEDAGEPGADGTGLRLSLSAPPRRRSTSSGWRLGREVETGGPGARGERRLRRAGLQFSMQFSTPAALHPMHARVAGPGAWRRRAAGPRLSGGVSLCTHREAWEAACEQAREPTGLAEERERHVGRKERETGSAGQHSAKDTKVLSGVETTLPASWGAAKEPCPTTTTASSSFSSEFSSPSISSAAVRSAGPSSLLPCLSPALVAAPAPLALGALSPFASREETETEAPARRVQSASLSASPFECLSPWGVREEGASEDDGVRPKRGRRNSGLSPLLQRLSLHGEPPTEAEARRAAAKAAREDEEREGKREEGQETRRSPQTRHSSPGALSPRNGRPSDGETGRDLATEATAFGSSRASLEQTLACCPCTVSSLAAPRSSAVALSHETKPGGTGDPPRANTPPEGAARPSRQAEEAASLSSLSPTSGRSSSSCVSSSSPFSLKRSGGHRKASLAASPVSSSRASRRPCNGSRHGACASLLGDADLGSAAVSAAGNPPGSASTSTSSHQTGCGHRAVSQSHRKRKAETPEGREQGSGDSEGGAREAKQVRKASTSNLRMPTGRAKARLGPRSVSRRRAELERHQRQKKEKVDSEE